MIVSSLFIVPMRKLYYIYYFINFLLNHNNNDEKLKTKCQKEMAECQLTRIAYQTVAFSDIDYVYVTFAL